MDKVITIKSARELFSILLEEADDDQAPSIDRVNALIEEKGLRIVNDTGALDAAITTALADSAKAIEDFKAGKQQALGAVIGKVMKQVKGADAKVVREMVIARLQAE